MSVGQRIKERRKELKLSQKELAEKLGYTSRSSITHIEKDSYVLSIEKVKAFAVALDCMPSYLLGLTDDEVLGKVDTGIIAKLSYDEDALNMIRMYLKLNREHQRAIAEQVEFFISKEGD